MIAARTRSMVVRTTRSGSPVTDVAGLPSDTSASAAARHAAPSRQITVYARHAGTRACGALLTAGRRGAVWPGARSSPGA